MRRLYESEAIRRDDDEPLVPNERRESYRVQASRWVNGTIVSNLLVPHGLRYRLLSIDVTTPEEEYAAGSSVPFYVTLKNSAPFPITVSTTSPVLWRWYVNDLKEASHVPPDNAPREEGTYRFDRGEHKRFEKRWNGLFRVSDTEWERAEPGTYTIGVRVSVDDPKAKGLYDETTVRLTDD